MNYKRGQFHREFLEKKAEHEALKMEAYDMQSAAAFNAEVERYNEWAKYTAKQLFIDSCTHTYQGVICEVVTLGSEISLIAKMLNNTEIAVEYAMTEKLQVLEMPIIPIVGAKVGKKLENSSVVRERRGSLKFEVLAHIGHEKEFIGYNYPLLVKKAEELAGVQETNKKPFILMCADDYYLGVKKISY